MAQINTQGVVTPPAGVTDGGFSEAASSFGKAASTALKIGQDLEQLEIFQGQKQAIEDGQKVSGETLEVPTREGRPLDFLRVTDEAYANASEVLAIQRAETAAESHLTDLEAKYALEPKAYQEASSAWLKNYLGGDIPSDLARTVEANFMSMQKDGLARISRDRRKKDLQETENGINAKVETLQQKMDSFLRENGASGAADPAFLKMSNELRDQLMIKAGNPAFTYSEEELERDLNKVSDAMRKSVAFKAAVDLYDAAGGNEEAVDIAYEGVESIVEALSLGADDAQSMRTALRKEINAKHDLNETALAQMDEEEKRRKDFVAANLKIGIERGQASYSDIERYKEDLSGSKYAELTLQADRVRKKRLDDANADAFGEALLAGTAVINPLDTKHQKALSTYYDRNVAPELEASADPVQTAVDFVTQTNVIPTSMENSLMANLLNGEPTSQIQAVNILSKIQKEAPVAFGELPSKVRRLSGYANMLQEAGFAPENAIIRARESLFVDDTITKARQAVLTKKNLEAAVKRGAKDLKMDGFKDSLGAQGDYLLMYEAEFLATGDEDAAHYMAQQRLNYVWGESAISDKPMRYPPEKLYGVGGMSDKQNGIWIKEEFNKFLEKEDSEAFQDKDYVSLKKRAELRADNETASGDGSYAVFYKAPDLFGGEVELPLVRDGVPVRWTPNWENSAQNKRIKKEKEKTIARNRALHRKKLYGEPLPPEFFESDTPQRSTNPMTGQSF